MTCIMFSRNHLLTLILFLLTTTSIVHLVLFTSPKETSPIVMPAEQAAAAAPTLDTALHISLRQTATSPPAITITVTNTSPHPLTLLTWDSPLDPLALQLGLLNLTAPHPLLAVVDIPTVQVSRQRPPGDEALVALAAGETAENTIVVLKEAVVAEKNLKGTRMRVALKGRWRAVWFKDKEALTAAERAQLVGATSGEFEADEIEIQVE